MATGFDTWFGLAFRSQLCLILRVSLCYWPGRDDFTTCPGAVHFVGSGAQFFTSLTCFYHLCLSKKFRIVWFSLVRGRQVASSEIGVWHAGSAVHCPPDQVAVALWSLASFTITLSWFVWTLRWISFGVFPCPGCFAESRNKRDLTDPSLLNLGLSCNCASHATWRS